LDRRADLAARLRHAIELRRDPVVAADERDDPAGAPLERDERTLQRGPLRERRRRALGVEAHGQQIAELDALARELRILRIAAPRADIAGIGVDERQPLGAEVDDHAVALA